MQYSGKWRWIKPAGLLAAVTTGTIYNPRMNIRAQIAAEMTGGPSRQVYVWELPTEKPAADAKE